MNIKNLTGLNPYNNRKVQEGAKPQQASNSSSSQSARASGDQVQLSPEARLLGTAHAEAEQAPDVRQDKVRELKEKVRNGTYKPDVKKAAANLIRDDLDLLVK